MDSLIYPVNYEYEFMEELKSMRVIEKLTLKLTPSNPNNRDRWKKYDERLRSMNVKTYKEEMEAEKKSSIELDEEAESKIEMAMDGYGKATGEGKDKDGNDAKISTDRKESIVKKRVNKDLDKRDQLYFLKDVFNNILERFRK